MPRKPAIERGRDHPPRFAARLLRWYAREKRGLPWRRTSDPYAIWISEVMLQQTTVNAVIPYYEKWLSLFPDATSLAGAPLRRVLKAWQGLGYYARARNLHAAAKNIVAEHQGLLPDDPAELRALPGFGAYTTSAVLSMAFGRRAPLVEANIRRVLMRVFGIRGEAGARNDKALLEGLEPFYPDKRPGEFNQALMELGALVCRPRSPLCLRCPLQEDCAAYAAGEQEIIPTPKTRILRQVTAVVGILEKNGRVLIQRRPARGLLGGLWEFPGGKVERGETPRAALARELREELGVETGSCVPFLTVDHSYTQYRVTLHAFECRSKSEPAVDGRRRKWVRISRLPDFPFPSGSARIVERLIERRSHPEAPPA